MRSGNISDSIALVQTVTGIGGISKYVDHISDIYIYIYIYMHFLFQIALSYDIVVNLTCVACSLLPMPFHVLCLVALWYGDGVGNTVEHLLASSP